MLNKIFCLVLHDPELDPEHFTVLQLRARVPLRRHAKVPVRGPGGARPPRPPPARPRQAGRGHPPGGQGVCQQGRTASGRHLCQGRAVQ